MDMRRHVSARTKPGLYFVGSLFPIIDAIIVYRQAYQIRALVHGAGQRMATSPEALFVWALVVFTLPEIASAVLKHRPLYLLLLAYIPLILALPIPILLMQRSLNAYKLHLRAARWTRRPYRFTGWQYLSMMLGIGLTGVFVALSYEGLQRDRGQSLATGTKTVGRSGAFRLTTPNADWVRVPTGTIPGGQDSTELELYGSTTETWAVANFYCSRGIKIDDLVESRKNAIAQSLKLLSFDEQRILLSKPFIPISFSRYSGYDNVFKYKQVWWVATTVTEQFMVEVIVGTLSNSVDEHYAEQLVKSIEIDVVVGNLTCGVL